MQDAMSATVRRLRLLAAAVVTAVAVLAATATGASAASSPCGPTDPRICVQNVGTPGTVAPSTDAFPTFVSYEVKVTNRAPSTATHVTLTNTTPGGSKLSSVTTDTGICSGLTVINCAFGSLASGVTATVTIVVEAPQVEGTVTNTATASFDEGPIDNPANPGKQDTVTVPEGTTVDAVLGAAVSLVPSGEEVRIDTSPTHAGSATPQDPTIGKALVPASTHAPLTATLNEDPTPFSCPKRLICRSGAWVRAEVRDQGGLPATFLAPNELQFELHWSKLLVSKQQTVKNLAVLHTACPVGCPIEVVSAQCSPANAPTNLPCLSNVAETVSDFRATLHSKTNGYMR